MTYSRISFGSRGFWRRGSQQTSCKFDTWGLFVAGMWSRRQLKFWGTLQETTTSTINPPAPSSLSSRSAAPELQVGSGSPCLTAADCWLLQVVSVSPLHPGTNDKPGGPHYVLRWTSPQVVKETHVPLQDWRYPYMGWVQYCSLLVQSEPSVPPSADSPITNNLSGSWEMNLTRLFALNLDLNEWMNVCEEMSDEVFHPWKRRWRAALIVSESSLILEMIRVIRRQTADVQHQRFYSAFKLIKFQLN